MIRRPVRFNGVAARLPVRQAGRPALIPTPKEFIPRDPAYSEQELNDLKGLIMQLSMKVEMMQGFFKIFESVKQGKRGDDGDTGNDGHTPTREELYALIEPLIPHVEDGHTPTQDEIEAVVRKYIIQPKDGKTPGAEEIAQALLGSKRLAKYINDRVQTQADAKLAEIKKEEPDEETMMQKIVAGLEKRGFSMPDIKKIETRFSEIRNQIASAPYNPPPGSKRGGGDTVVAGTGVTITNTRNGNKQITATGVVATWRTPPETPDGVITIFTVTAEPATVVSDGTTLFAGQGYSYAALQITFVNPPALYVRYQT